MQALLLSFQNLKHLTVRGEVMINSVCMRVCLCMCELYLYVVIWDKSVLQVTNK